MFITEKRKKILFQLLCFFIAFILHEIVNVFMRSPWAMGDELGVLSTGAAFAGLDWSTVFKVMSDTFSEVNYYGGGFGILFTPLFSMLKNRPFLLYQIILAICAVVQSVPAFLACRILHKYGVQNKFFVFFISIASTFFVTSRATNVMNENMLILNTWLIFYFLTILFEENLSYIKRSIYSVILSFVICYSYTVHSRSLILAAGVFFVLIISAILFKKRVVSLIPFLLSLFVFALLANSFNEIIKSYVFKVSEGAIVYNTGSTAATSIVEQVIDLFKEGMWQAFGDVFLTNILGLTIVTALMILITFSIWIRLSYKTTISTIKKEQTSKENIELLLMGAFIFSCVVLMIGLYSIQGIANTALALEEGNCTRSHFYLRYPGAFCGPFVTLLGIFIWKKMYKFKDTFFALICMIATGAYTIWSIGGRIWEKGDPQFDFYHFFSPFCLKGYEEQINGVDFVKVIVITTTLGVVISLFIKYKKAVLSACLIAILFLYQYIYLALNFDIPSSKELHYSVISSVSLFQENDELYDLIEKVYVPLISGRWESSYVLQYYLPEIEVIRDMPDNKEENIMVITFSQIWDNDDFEGYEWCQMADGSFLYVKGEKYIYELEKCGLDLIAYEE